MGLVTVGVMFALNYLAGVNATARQLIRGKSVAPVNTEKSNGFLSGFFG
jgi:hypothetical protein